MTDKEDQERLWKKEADQQRQDNLKKGKVIKRREVPIKFGGKKEPGPSKVKPTKKSVESRDSEQDDLLRRQLGL